MTHDVEEQIRKALSSLGDEERVLRGVYWRIPAQVRLEVQTRRRRRRTCLQIAAAAVTVVVVALVVGGLAG